MEITELRYFFAVASVENVNLAAKRFPISASSLSKAVAKLEEELGVRLFDRVGRGIQLTEQGHQLKQYARKLIDLEEEYRLQIGGIEGRIKISIAGPESLLSQFGPEIADRVRENHSEFEVDFRHCEDHEVNQYINDGNAHLGLSTHSVAKGLSKKTLDDVEFKTCAGATHPIYARKKPVFHVSEVLEHGFVSPSRPILGKINNSLSLDGWRDDKFPRRIEYYATNLDLIGQLVMSGNAIAYLPEYYVDRIGALELSVEGCPYVCKQKVYLLSKRHTELSWLDALYSSF